MNKYGLDLSEGQEDAIDLLLRLYPHLWATREDFVRDCVRHGLQKYRYDIMKNTQKEVRHDSTD